MVANDCLVIPECVNENRKFLLTFFVLGFLIKDLAFDSSKAELHLLQVPNQYLSACSAQNNRNC